MSWHPTDEDLILHFYGEGPGDEGRVDEHLRGCASCRDMWMEISETLKLVDAAAIPEPGPAFERVMWARVRPALPRRHAARVWWSPRRLVPLAGLAALVVAAVLVTRSLSTTPIAPPPPAPAPVVASSAAADAKARERVLLFAAGDHFEQAEMVLVELMNSPSVTQIDLGFEREMADNLVASGRLYHETAAADGETHLARMLEDLESVLVEVARSPQPINRRDLRSLRARIDDQSLLFKVRAVTSEIRERQRTLATFSEGPQ